jgi:hypothetical protein
LLVGVVDMMRHPRPYVNILGPQIVC